MAFGFPFVTHFDPLLGVFALETPELVTGLIAAAVLPALIIGLVLRAKAKQAQTEAAATLEKVRFDAEAAAKAAQAEAAARVDEANRKLVEVTAKLQDTEQRFATHRDVSDRRQTDAAKEISRLEADLTAVKEVAAQLGPTQARIKDLEIALAAEQGRVQAQEQAIAATNARAVDFEKRMMEAHDIAAKHKTAQQEIEAELKVIRDEQAARAAEGGPEAELAKAHEANRQLEVKIGNLQRALKSTEARVEMVQKEFMNAVGMPSAPVAGAAASSGGNDKRVRELEEKLAQTEAESRKRAREDGYKIAELEYRLSEALESATPAPQAPQPAAEPVVEPKSEPVAKPPPEPETPPAPAPTPEPPHEEAKASTAAKPAPAKPAATPSDELPLGDSVS